MAQIYWLSDGCGRDVGDVPVVLAGWIRDFGNADLVVYGGDVYHQGSSSEFDEFLAQIGPDFSRVCAVPGNHEWRSAKSSSSTGEIPDGFESFWMRLPPPQSQRPIDASKQGSARYDHVIDMNGWRLIFVDTARAGHDNGYWPKDDEGRVQWLNDALTSVPGRSKIVFTHHSRLSLGIHGDNGNVDPLWQSLFDSVTQLPLVACTFGGHDHNVSVYQPRAKDHPGETPVPYDQGIYVFVNGLGGSGRHEPVWGSAPEFKHSDSFCISRITLIDERSADIDVLSFGPTAQQPPTPLDQSLVMIRN